MNVMNIKLVLSFLLLIAGLGGFYILFDHPLVFRILSVLVGFVAATYVFSTTSQGDRLLKFIKEAITEAKKVVWPTRKETIQMTLVVFVLGIVGFYMLDEQPLVFKVVSILVGLSASLFVFKQSSKGDELFNFLNSVVLEAKKVVWPTRKETVQMTLVVFVVVVLMAIFLAFVDIAFTYIVNLVLGR